MEVLPHTPSPDRLPGVGLEIRTKEETSEVFKKGHTCDPLGRGPVVRSVALETSKEVCVEGPQRETQAPLLTSFLTSTTTHTQNHCLKVLPLSVCVVSGSTKRILDSGFLYHPLGFPSMSLTSTHRHSILGFFVKHNCLSKRKGHRVMKEEGEVIKGEHSREHLRPRNIWLHMKKKKKGFTKFFVLSTFSESL